jgi:hypothetical protein
MFTLCIVKAIDTPVTAAPDAVPSTTKSLVVVVSLATNLIPAPSAVRPSPAVAANIEVNSEKVAPTFYESEPIVQPALTLSEWLPTNETVPLPHGLKLKLKNDLVKHDQERPPQTPTNLNARESKTSSPQEWLKRLTHFPTDFTISFPTIPISTSTHPTTAHTAILPILYELTLNNIYLCNFLRAFNPWMWTNEWISRLWTPGPGGEKFGWLDYVVMVLPTVVFYWVYIWRVSAFFPPVQ